MTNPSTSDLPQVTSASPPARRRADPYDALLNVQHDLSDAYFVLEETKLVYTSPAFCRLCGCEVGEINSFDAASALLAPEARPTILAGYRARRMGVRLPERCEATIVHRRGDRIEAELSIRTISISAGRLQSLVLVRDISARKRSEEAHMRALAENARLQQDLRDAYREKNALLRDILRIVTDGRLHLCDSPFELPAPIASIIESEALCEIVLTPENLFALRRLIEQATKAAGLSETRAYDLMTAACELAMNAIVHAEGGFARVITDPAAGRVQVWVYDRGSGIALSQLHRATLERGFTTAGSLGQGFKLALLMSDRLYLLTGPEGTTVVVEQERLPQTQEFARSIATD